MEAMVPRRVFAISMALASATFLLSPPVFAQNAAKLSTITMAIGAGPGSGYDSYARLAARHLGRFLPVSPNIVATNMPGADGLQEATWLYQTAPKDGSAIGILENSTPYEPLLVPAQAGRLDAQKLNWLGSLNSIANIVLVWDTSPIKSVQELFDKEVIVGATSGNSDSLTMPKLLNRMIGTKFKIVAGYSSSNEVVLAMDRGEVEGALGISSDSLQGPFGGMLRDKKFRILMQIGLEKAKDSFLQNVPSIMDYVKDETQRNVLKLILAKLQYGRPFAAPPGLPPQTVQQLRVAFQKMAADPEFLADAQKLNLPVAFSSGEEINRSIAEVYKTPSATVQQAIAILGSAAN